MIRFVRRGCLLGVLVCLPAAAPSAFAQLALRSPQPPIIQLAGSTHGELHGVINDERGQPLTGAVVSALGSTTAFALSDRDGRFSFRNLPAGPYLVRAHLQGYVPARARVMQVNAGMRNMSTIELMRRSDGTATPPVLAAGVGAADVPVTEVVDEHEHDEVAWRLRHLKRSVLKEAEQAIAELGGDRSFVGDSLSGLSKAMGSSARFASALFADFPLSGQINLLTSASFDRPQDLFAINAGVPRGIAYLALEA